MEGETGSLQYENTREGYLYYQGKTFTLFGKKKGGTSQFPARVMAILTSGTISLRPSGPIFSASCAAPSPPFGSGPYLPPSHSTRWAGGRHRHGFPVCRPRYPAIPGIF